MLPRNIDLTENRDFSVFYTELSTTLPLRHMDDDDYVKMTADEYEGFVWWENIFGRNDHTNEKRVIFGKNETFNEEMRTHCLRCGKELKMPWKRFLNICEECDNAIVYGFERLPWKVWKQYTSEGEPLDSIRDLFNLR